MTPLTRGAVGAAVLAGALLTVRLAEPEAPPPAPEYTSAEVRELTGTETEVSGTTRWHSWVEGWATRFLVRQVEVRGTFKRLNIYRAGTLYGTWGRGEIDGHGQVFDPGIVIDPLTMFELEVVGGRGTIVWYVRGHH